MMSHIILASGSPRRAELLSQVGLDYTVVVPDVDERAHEDESPRNFVSRMSREKASSVAGSVAGLAMTGSVVVAADTIVVIGGDILGKPRDRHDATSMLQRLSGRSHEVMTSVTVRQKSRIETKLVETIVRFRALNLNECYRYWLSGEAKDKAGAYGIQGLGAIFVESIEGSYSNVVGLPLAETTSLLMEFGVQCLPKITDEELILD
jgi:septum formation protein